MAVDLASLAERQGWTVADAVATFEPMPGAWVGRVRALAQPDRASDR